MVGQGPCPTHLIKAQGGALPYHKAWLDIVKKTGVVTTGTSSSRPHLHASGGGGLSRRIKHLQQNIPHHR